MKKILLFSLLFSQSILLFAQTTRVVLETGGHVSNIKMIQFTNDGKQVITASDDKTCRVWDIETGVLVNILRGEISEGNYGMLNTGAVMPNSNIVSVGGYLGKDGEANGKVRFYNYITGEIAGMGRGPEGSLVSMDYSKDGNFLAAGSTAGEIAIWDLNTMYPYALGGHKDGVYGVAFSPDGNKLVTGSYDKKAILWDVSFLKDSTKELGYTLLEDHTESIRAVAFSPNGEYFITGGYDNRILMYDNTGKLIKEVAKIMDETYGEKYGFGDIHSLAISEDGKLIAVGTSVYDNKNVRIIEASSGKEITAFTKHDNTVMAIDFYGNNLVASAGGENRDIYVWEAKSGKVKAHFVGQGKRVYRVGLLDENQIAYGQTGYDTYNRTMNSFGDAEKVFDIDNFSVYPINDASKVRSEITVRDGFTLKNSGTQQLYILNEDGEVAGFTELNPDSDGGIRCFTYTDAGEIIIGTNYRIIMFDGQLNRLRVLNGHTADVYSLASKGRTLVSGSADQTIRVWNLDDEGRYDYSMEEYKQYFINQGITEEKIEQYLNEKGMTFEDLYYSANSKKVVPIAVIYASDIDWIIYDDNNYYATSKNGSRHVGFHINQDYKTEAKFHSFRQFDIQLNRPDKILETFHSKNNELKTALITARKKRIDRSGFKVSEKTEVEKAPKLVLKNLPEVVKEEKYKLRFDLSGDNLQKLNLYVNGVPVQIAGGNDLKHVNNDGGYTFITYSCNFELIPGKNQIEIWATNGEGITSSVETVTVYYEPEKTEKPDLYVVSIGVSEYKDKNFNLTYASKDAKDISETLKSTKQYSKVNSLVLIDKDFTANKLEDIKTFLANANSTDHVVIFYAGHGLFDSKFDYYLATYDMNFSKPQNGGFPYEKFENMLTNIRARNKLVLIDACHSGEVDKDEVILASNTTTSNKDVKFRSVNNSVAYKSGLGISSFTLMKNMFTDMNDKTGATILSSAGGMEFAMESGEWKNGLFTYSFIDGLKNKKADSNNDGTVDVNEINLYVRSMVTELSEGKQVPTSRKENVETNFTIWK